MQVFKNNHIFFCITAVLLLTLISCSHVDESTTKKQAKAITRKPIPSTYFVDCNNNNASDDSNGSFSQPFKTISAAAKRAIAGDIITICQGIYRERIMPAASGTHKKPIVYQAYPGEKVVVKGSNLWTPIWQQEDCSNIYKAVISPTLFPDGINPFHIGISIASHDLKPKARPSTESLLPLTLGQIFIDSLPAKQVQSKEELKNTSNSWLVSPDGTSVSIHFAKNKTPENCTVEISIRNRIFCPKRRGLNHIHIKGFTFEHCANQGPFPQGGAVSVRSGNNWVIENNTIRYAKTIGLDCGSETWSTKDLPDTLPEDRKLILGGGHIIRNNTITDNGLCGIAGWNHRGTKIVKNILERNNRLHFGKPLAKWEEWGAIKLHCTDAVIEGNLVRDNEEFGIWIDNGYRNAKIQRNVIINNKGAGIFLELGKGRCLIANNIIIGTRTEGKFYPGFGVYAHDAADITVANNFIFKNSSSAILMRKITKRKFGGKPTETSNEYFFNNIMIGNGSTISLPYPFKHSKNNKSDFNYFSDNNENQFKLIWSLGSPSRKKLATTVKTALVQSNSSTSLQQWLKDGCIDLALWRNLMNMDQHSILSTNNLNISYNPASLELSFTPSKQLLGMAAPSIQGIQYDFTGEPLPENEKIKPGPFQDLSNKPFKIKLWPVNKARNLFELSSKPANPIPVKSWDIINFSTDKGIWKSCIQKATAPLTNLNNITYYKGNSILQTTSTRGVKASPARIIMFKSPKTSWYTATISGILKKRTAHTAGYANVKLYLLSPKMTRIHEIKSFRLNTQGGFGKHPNEFAFHDKIGIKKDFYLALAFQVIAPGPAPAGLGKLHITNWQMQELETKK